MTLRADRYQWEVDEWRDKFNDVQAKLDGKEKEFEFHVAKLERTVAWLTVRLQETETDFSTLRTSLRALSDDWRRQADIVDDYMRVSPYAIAAFRLRLHAVELDALIGDTPQEPK